MKKTYILSLLFLFVSILSTKAALPPAEKAVPFAHLSEVNKEWFKQECKLSNHQVSFANDKQRIRFHLLSVIDVLKQRSTKDLSTDQRANRNHLLNELTHYALAMDFPINSYHNERQPYFIDEFDNYCAVGYLIKVSGYESVAREIQQSQNYSYIAEINHPLLPTWAAKFGFELSELALIQPTYAPNNSYDAIGQGTDNNVTSMFRNQDQVYFVGDFTEVDGDPCNHVGVYNSNGSVECVLNGLEGTLNTITFWNNKLWVGGLISHNGINYPLASFENNQWQYHQIGLLTNAEAADIRFYHASGCYVSIRNGSDYELWMLTPSGTWQHRATTNGPIHTSAFHVSKYVFAGDFSTVTILYGAGNNQVLNTNNMFSIEQVGGQWQAEAWTAYSGNVPSSINVIEAVGNVLYIGGSDNDQNPLLLVSYLNDTFQTLVQSPDFANEYYSIRDIEFTNSSTLMIAGDLGMSLMEFPSMTFGQHLYSYDVLSGYISPMAIFNQPVNSIVNFDGQLIIGGEFTENMGTALNHLAKSSVPTSIAEDVNEAYLSFYPNPASSNLQIDFNEHQMGELCITDLSGRVLLSENITGKNKLTLDVSHLSSQVVFVSIVENNKTVKTERLIIQ